MIAPRNYYTGPMKKGHTDKEQLSVPEYITIGKSPHKFTRP